MARSVQQIQADLDSVNAEMASSESMVRGPDGREIQSRTTSSAVVAKAALQVELAAAQAVAGNTSRVRQIRLSGSSGFGNGGW